MSSRGLGFYTYGVASILNDSLDAIQLLVEIAYTYEACDVMSFFLPQNPCNGRTNTLESGINIAVRLLIF